MSNKRDQNCAQPVRRRLLLCGLGSGLGLAVTGCAVPMRDARKMAVPAETTPVITWRYVVPDGSGLSVPQASDVASALAAVFPGASRYGAVRDGRRYYANLEVSGAGTRESGLQAIQRTGVEAVAGRQQVQLTYASGLKKFGQPDLISKTRCTLMVNAVSGQPDQFSVAMTPVEEAIARDVLFFPQPPLDTMDAIRNDVVATLNKILPVITMTTSHSEEIDAPYPPAAVLANFERAFGRNDVTDQPKDRRDGRFKTSPAEGKVGTWVWVRIDPYRNGSKILAKYGLKVQLKPDGSTDFEQAQLNALHAQVRRVALQ